MSQVSVHRDPWQDSFALVALAAAVAYDRTVSAKLIHSTVESDIVNIGRDRLALLSVWPGLNDNLLSVRYLKPNTNRSTYSP